LSVPFFGSFADNSAETALAPANAARLVSAYRGGTGLGERIFDTVFAEPFVACKKDPVCAMDQCEAQTPRGRTIKRKCVSA
jgi:hypothetical protein